MKASKELQKNLLSQIKEFSNLHSENFKSHYLKLSVDPKVKDLKKRFLWDILWALPNKAANFNFIKDQNLDNKNIYTLLCSIEKKLGLINQYK